MNKVITTVIAAAGLTLAATSAQAQNWALFGNYTDVTVYQHFDANTNSLGVNPGNNTWSSPTTMFPTDRINAYVSDADTANMGGFRWLDAVGNPGGGSDRAYGGSLYFIRSDYSPIGSPDGYTRVGNGALTPGQIYTVAAYSIIGGSKDTTQYTLNGGTTWTPIIDTASLTPLLGGGADWLQHSQVDAIGTPGVKDGDTRFRVIIGDAVADASGNVVVGFRDPNLRSTGGSSDRGRADGFAVALGPVSQVPEPTTFALAGLGAAALLIFRRRS